MSKKRFQPKLKIKKGDNVIVIAGAEKGSTGEVLEVFPHKNRAIVSDVNLKTKHRKPTQEQAGDIIEVPASIHISNLMLLDQSGNPTRVGRRKEGDKIVRFAKSTGNTL